MSTVTPIRSASAPPRPRPAPTRALHAGAALEAAARLVADLDPDDGRWVDAGRHLTAVVDGVRRAAGGAGSPIGPHDEVSPLLRLRDLARAAQAVAGAPRPLEVAEPVSAHLVALAAAVAT